MTLLDPDVIERAVEDALRGSSGGTGPRSPISEAVFSHVCREVEQAVREQAPIVAAAAYRQGREGLEARIEKARRLLIELEQSVDAGAGLIPANILEPRLNEIFAALSEYRDETEGER